MLSRNTQLSTTSGEDSWATHVRAAVVSTIVLTVIVSGAYPLVVWALAQLLFPHQANGSLLYGGCDGKTVIGSSLIGQTFTADKYFQPRPSAAGTGYDPISTGGTNLGPTSDKLINGIHKKTPDGHEDPNNFDGVKDLVKAYRITNGLAPDQPVPADAVTRSGSGVDPHISLANARLQAPRVAKARGMNTEAVRALIDQNTDGPDLGILGDPAVNVLKLNIALDARK